MRFKEFKEGFLDMAGDEEDSDGGNGLLKSFLTLAGGGKEGMKSLLKKNSIFKQLVPDEPDTPDQPNKSTATTSGKPISSTSNPISSTGTSPSASGQRTPASAVSGSGRPSEQLINYIKHNESFSPKAFWDYKQWTNGYGTKARSRGEVIDEREADRRLRQKAQEFYDIVVRFDQAHKYGFSDSQRDALTSFILNGGPGWLNQVSNNGRRSKEQIAKAMTEYNTAGGKRLGGLARRRREEVAMFSAGSNMA
jgi:GH24 family phage-related lysozyme (muramidase)